MAWRAICVCILACAAAEASPTFRGASTRRLDSALDNAPWVTDSVGDTCVYYQFLQRYYGWRGCDNSQDTEDFKVARCADCQPALRNVGPSPVSLMEELGKLPASTTAIRLPRMVANATVAFNGSLPADLTTRFPNLEVLDLSMHDLEGGIPSSLLSLPSLKELHLSGNKLSGVLPESISPGLTKLRLSGNRITGVFPARLGALAELTWLDLSGTGFTGALPTELGALAKLSHVDLSSLSLDGGIPKELGNWQAVRRLNLARTRLSGSIPPEVGGWVNLEELWLRGNQLTGAIPKEVGSWRQLRLVNLGKNKLSGSIPPEVGGWVNLEELTLEENELTGAIPKEVGSWGQLRRVNLAKNKLSGSIPAEVGGWVNLEELNLEENKLEGAIPREVGSWGEVRSVKLTKNLLTGSIPATVGGWKKLENLEASGNQLSGQIPPDVGNWQSVSRVSMEANRLSGAIPKEVGRWQSITYISLPDNELSEQIPAELGSCQTLGFLALANNKLTGVLPESLGNMSRLYGMDLSRNSFTGAIPVELGKLSGLRSLNLAHNHLTGPLPTELGSLPFVIFFQLGHNRLSGPIPPTFGATWWSLLLLSLEHNQFSGPLPFTVGSWGSIEDVLLGENNLTGPLPSSVGSWRNVRNVQLGGNSFTGELPSEVEHWSLVRTVNLSGNSFTGAVPSGLGYWRTRTEEVNLDLNGFTSLPESLQNMSKLRTLSIQGNRLQGKLPDLGGLDSLAHLHLQGNSLTGTGTLPVNLKTLDLSKNRLQALPAAFDGLPKLETLNLEGNLISSWPARGLYEVLTAIYWAVTFDSVHRFPWTFLQRLDVSNNPLLNADVTPSERAIFGPAVPNVRVFLTSLAHLQHLTFLACRNCSLTGPLDAQSLPGLADARLCTLPYCEVAKSEPGFPSLQTLDLAENAISAVAASPSKALRRVDFSANALESLDLSWFNLERQNALRQNVLEDLKISGNARLRVPVEPPKGPCGKTVMALVADPSGYLPQAEDHECTQLCDSRTAYSVDFELDEGALCRCRPGYMGAGKNCTACERGTFSEVADTYGTVRTCERCPSGSSTRVTMATDVSQCRCPVGTFLENRSCVECAQAPFRTTHEEGALSKAACHCSKAYEGLKENAERCGCDDGKYMDHVAKRCEDCSNAELCIWGLAINESLVPPRVKAGFWPEPIGDTAAFARNSIWRCTSAESCQENGVCAEGRHGRACGLCQPGTHGGPDSACTPCGEELSKEERRWLLAAGALGLVVPGVIFVHVGLTGESDSFGLLMQLKAVRGSLKQMVKHLQTVTVIGGMSVSWPPLALSFFHFMGRFTLSFPTLLAAGCMGDEASATFDMVSKWCMPPIFVVLAALAMPASWVLARLLLLLPCRGGELGKKLADEVTMSVDDVLRILLFALTIFWSTLVANSFEILTCIPSPNSVLTVATHPQLECDFRVSEFLGLALASLATIIVYLGMPLFRLYRGYEGATVSIASSLGEERGWFAFLFEDFRDGRLLWLMEIMLKDALFVVVPAAMPGQGALQLLLLASASAGHGVLVMQSAPFHDRSNTVLEAWNAAFTAVLCIYSVGMGYEQTAGMEDVAELFEEGAEDPIYKGRAIGMVMVQVVTVAVPAIVVTYQLLCAVQSVRKRLPKRMQPITQEEDEAWLVDFMKEAQVSERLGKVLQRFDENDVYQFRCLMQDTCATMGQRLSRKSTSKLVRMATEMHPEEETEEEKPAAEEKSMAQEERSFVASV